MTQQFSEESNSEQAVGFKHRLSADIPTIKILLYADDPFEVIETSAKERALSLGLMLAHLKAHEPASARIRTTYVCRYSPTNLGTVNRIHTILENEARTGAPFDQIWFFGIHQVNITAFSPSFFRGGPENELDADEVRGLASWMTADEANGFPGGGILMTGDHSNERPDDALVGKNPLCPDQSSVASRLGLGRAVGRCVPRAGQLRIWEGDPTSDPASRHNTVESPGDEFDNTGQRLILRNVNELGEPDEAGGHHPLFFYKPNQSITFFPDHPHEGSLAIPDTSDRNIWPPQSGPQPIPHVVAYGINQRTLRFIDLVATYHGDRAGVGRIVAGSTWHHYFNANLRGFPNPAPAGTPADQIGQFYANLAVWLSPTSKRQKMAHALFWRLANYTIRLERRSDDPEPELTIGEATYRLLSQTASPCEIHELLQAVTPKRYSALRFREGGLLLDHVPSRELLLGSIMCSYHDEMLSAETDESYEAGSVDKVIASGFIRAFRKQVSELGAKREEALKFLEIPI